MLRFQLKKEVRPQWNFDRWERIFVSLFCLLWSLKLVIKNWISRYFQAKRSQYCINPLFSVNPILIHKNGANDAQTQPTYCSSSNRHLNLRILLPQFMYKQFLNLFG